jgi:hypothetical protein
MRFAKVAFEESILPSLAQDRSLLDYKASISRLPEGYQPIALQEVVEVALYNIARSIAGSSWSEEFCGVMLLGSRVMICMDLLFLHPSTGHHQACLR